jgi:hypothetical protein
MDVTLDGVAGGPGQNTVQVFGREADVGVGLDEQGRCCGGGAVGGPFVVEGGEVVVDPGEGVVGGPSGDVVAFPEVAVGVAGGDGSPG